MQHGRLSHQGRALTETHEESLGARCLAPGRAGPYTTPATNRQISQDVLGWSRRSQGAVAHALREIWPRVARSERTACPPRRACHARGPDRRLMTTIAPRTGVSRAGEPDIRLRLRAFDRGCAVEPVRHRRGPRAAGSEHAALRHPSSLEAPLRRLACRAAWWAPAAPLGCPWRRQRGYCPRCVGSASSRPSNLTATVPVPWIANATRGRS
jgi:hypothetical protein